MKTVIKIELTPGEAKWLERRLRRELLDLTWRVGTLPPGSMDYPKSIYDRVKKAFGSRE